MTIEHWHVATGIAGYGPDGENDGVTDDLYSACIMAADECSAAADYLHEGAAPLAESGDYKAAYLSLAYIENTLEPMIANLNVTKRREAPLFQGEGGETLLDQSMRALLAKFPLDCDPEGTRRIYVWDDCQNGDECLAED